MKATCYHTRKRDNNMIKVCGGSLSADTLDIAAAQFCAGNRGLTIKAVDSTRTTFVDERGREVMLYLSVDPSESPQGQQVLKEYRIQKAERDAQAAKLEEIEEEKRQELLRLAESIGLDKALQKLQ